MKRGSVARVLVIGGGVSGLTTSLCLRRSGFEVVVVADRFASGTTSTVAGALWEWPPSVCGRHHDQRLLGRSKVWCMTSYEVFAELAKDAHTTGVYLRPAVFYLKRLVEEDPLELAKMNEMKDRVRDFVHSPALIAENGVNPDFGVKDAYSLLAPMVDTDRYLVWLLREVISSGCEVRQQRMRGNLLEREDAIRREFEVDAIVNCSGLGSTELARDTDLSPHRGALIRVHNDGRAMPRITSAHCVAHDASRGEQDMVFIVPRGEDTLVLGGLVEPDEWGLDIGLDNYEPVRAMFRRCVEFLPVLAHAQIDQAEPVRVGLRPFRREDVRLEREPGGRLVHNYGHGGAGISLSWGCARETVELVERCLAA